MKKHAVLLLHGLAGSPVEMAYLKMALSTRGYDVHIPLLPGHGTHFKDLRSLAWSTYVEATHLAFQKLLTQYEKVSVGGLCLGAVLALELAATFGDRVHCVFPISTTLFFDGWGLPKVARWMPLIRMTPAYYFYDLKESEPYGIKDDNLRAWIQNQMSDSSVTHYSRIPFKAAWQMHLLCRNVKSRLKAISSPVLAIHPIEDDVSSLKSVQYMQAHISPRLFQSLLLNDCYHLATIDRQRGEVARAVLQFLKTGAGSSSVPLESSAG